MEENEEYSVYELDEDDKSFLKSKTPASLPDNPSDKRWSASQIKNKMYEGYLVLFEWIKRLTSQVNTLASKMKADSDAEFVAVQNSITNLQAYVESLEDGKATFDEYGNRISTTYSTKEELNGYVPKNTTINNKELTNNVTLEATDIGLDDLDQEELDNLWEETN